MASPNTRANEDREELDLYNTPHEAVSVFYEKFPEVFDEYDVFWDPCDGLGPISGFLKSIGKTVIKSDIKDRTGALHFVADFLSATEVPEGVECVVFNPPFKKTAEFVAKACGMGVDLVMFNRTSFIDSQSRAVKLASGEWPLAHMYQFAHRVECTRGEEMRPCGTSVAYAWFHFSKKMGTKRQISWIL